MDRVIITVAVVGSNPSRMQNENLPITPEEIADSAVEAYEAGATIAHFHVRDEQTQLPSSDLSLFARVVKRVRAKCDMIINLTTSGGGSLFISPDGEYVEELSNIQGPEARVAHVIELKPEMCSLDIGTMNFGPGVFANTQGVIDKMAELIKDNGTKPEVELFDIGHIATAHRLSELGLLEKKSHFQLCMGTAGGVAATLRHAVHFAESLPPECTWSIFGVGPSQFPMVGAGVLLGGHVRVGFEDNLYMKKGVKAKSNAELVEHTAKIIHDFNKEVATVDQARKILGLKPVEAYS